MTITLNHTHDPAARSWVASANGHADFPIQIFFETNSNGLDIIYLRQGPVQLAAKAEAMDPSQMIIIHSAVRPNLGDIQTIGLIGYGGETQTVIWPLVFFGE